MAFGGRELRLILSIQSYGTSNIAKLRRDIMSLAATARSANVTSAGALRVGAQSINMQRVAGEKLDTLNQKLLRQKAQQIRLEERLGKELRKTYTAQGAGTILASGKMPTRLGTPAAKALTLESQALKASIAQTTRQFEYETAAMEKNKAAMFQLVHAGLPLILMQEREARALEANIARLQETEIAGRSAAHIGRTLQFTGLLVTAGFGMAAGTAAKFSKEVGLAATQMRDIGAPISDTAKKSAILGDAITKMMMKFPASSEEMTKAAYDIFSSMNLVHNGVVDVSSGLGLLEVANKAAVAGQVSLQEATGAMIPILNNFDPGLRHVGKTMDEVFSIVRFGQMRLNDFATAMSSLAPIAASTGISLKNMGGPFATLTLLMKNQQRAALGLGRLFELLNLPAFSIGFRKMGVEVYNANHQLRPLLDIMKDIVKVHPEVGTGQKAAIEFFIQVSKASGLTKAGIQGTIQARRAFSLLATQLGLFADTQAHVNKNSGEMSRAFKFMSQQPGVQWSVLINQMKAFAIVIGQAVLPVFLAIGQKISDMIQWFMRLSPHTKQLITRFLAIGGLFALFGGTILNVVGSVVALSANLKLMGLAAEGSARKFLALKLVVGTLAFAGVGIILAQIIGLKRAVADLTTVWVVWRSKAIISAAVVAAANVAAAIASGTAWSTFFASFDAAAIASTGGLFAIAIAAGIAVDYMMTHWDKTRAFFTALVLTMKEQWKALMKELAALTIKGVAELSVPLLALTDLLSKIPGMGFLKGATGIFHKAINSMLGGIGLGAAQTGDILGKTFWMHYNQQMDKYAKERNKKGKKNDEDFIKAYKAMAKKLLSADLLKQLGLDQSGAGSIADQLAKAHAAALKQAQQDMQNTIKQGVSNIANLYTQFRQTNEQGLGQIFGGPTMTGMIGSFFSDINDQLRQFGVQIPVPFQILKKDADQQLAYFKRWRGDLGKLLKAGAPLEMVQSIEQLGPNAIPMIEGLLGASPKQQRQYFATWKKGQTQLDKAAQSDLNKQLKYWQSFGKSAAYKMVMGLNDGLKIQQLSLQKTWKTYIVDTFGKILHDALVKQVNQAMKDAKAQATAGAGGGTGVGTGIGAGTKAGTQRNWRPAHAVQEIQAYQRKIRQDTAAINRMAKGGFTPTEKARSTALAFNIGRQRYNIEQARKRELASITAQMHKQSVAYGPHRMPTYTVTYMGDTITVKADGATPASVMRALNKHHFRKKNKTHR